MTHEEKTRILEAALDRAYTVISKTPGDQMGSPEFRTLIKNVADMDWLIGRRALETSDSEPREPEPETPCGPGPEPEPENPPETVDNDETEDPEEPKFKMEEVRAALAKARAQGVNVAEIIRSFGADNFQQIDKGKYPTIMAKLAEKGVA